jgi:hypothetical protein
MASPQYFRQTQQGRKMSVYRPKLSRSEEDRRLPLQPSIRPPRRGDQLATGGSAQSQVAADGSGLNHYGDKEA